MKTFFFVTLLFAFRFCSSQELAISQLNIKTFYIGIENPISIVCSKISCEHLLIIVNNGIAKKIENCDYIINPKYPGNVQIKVFSVLDKDTLLIDSLNYKSKFIPTPKARMNPRVSEFDWNNKRLKYLSAEIENSEIDLHFKIKSFCIALQQDNQLIDSVYINGAFVDNHYIELLKKGKVGDKIWFKDIEAIIENSDMVFYLDPFYLKFKE